MYHLLRGLYEELTTPTEYKVLVIGLENSGKTTFVESTKEIYTNKKAFISGPTIGQNIVKIPVSNTILTFWDLGGSDNFISLWDKYYDEAHAILYFIDGTNKSSLYKSWKLFESMKVHPSLNGIPIIVCITKQDNDGCLNDTAIQTEFRNYSIKTPNLTATTTNDENNNDNLTLSQKLQKFSNDEDDQHLNQRNLILNLISYDEGSIKNLIDNLFIRVQTSVRSKISSNNNFI